MATASSLLSEDQFLCSVCLKFFTEPVSIPCGHNFCKACITQHWDSAVLPQCPMCKKEFPSRPELYVNTFLSEMMAQFRQVQQQRVKGGEQQVQSGEVPCDVCPGAKVKAVKSCLQCLTSYCQTHLEPHLTTAGLKRHQLMEPQRNLEDRMCQKHQKVLEMFCRTDEVCVCQFCTEADHKGHDIVTLQRECSRKKSELKKKDDDIQQKIQRKHQEIQELKYDLKLSAENAARDKDASRKVLTGLIHSIETTLTQLIDSIEETQKTREKKVEGFIKELEEEIFDLEKESSKVKLLSQNEDHLDVLQGFSSLCSEPHRSIFFKIKHLFGLSSRRVETLYEGTVKLAVSQLENVFTEEMKKLRTYVDLEKFRQYAVEVTLDAETAHPQLVVSDDGKQVSLGTVKQNVPDSLKRFSSYSVISLQSFSSGRFYYEVQVKDKPEWIVGVVTESINRKSTGWNQNECWGIEKRGSSYQDVNSKTNISMKSQPQRVGVFVDCENNQISYYDADTAAHLHSVHGKTFTEKLYPYFNLGLNHGGQNSSPLVIWPVALQ